jgi:hypothetical protein
VLMGDGTRKIVSQLAVGDNVMCFGGSVGTVVCCITSVIQKKIKMCHLPSVMGGCWITFEHPVLFSEAMGNSLFDAGGNCLYEHLDSLDAGKIAEYNLSWALPMDICPVQKRFQSYIYNFTLDCHHTLNVSGHWCATLGHDYKGHIIEHEFWGDSVKVRSFLQNNSNTYPNVRFRSQMVSSYIAPQI